MYGYGFFLTRYSDPHFSFLATNSTLTDNQESSEMNDKIGSHSVGVWITHRAISIKETVGMTRLVSLNKAGKNVIG